MASYTQTHGAGTGWLLDHVTGRSLLDRCEHGLFHFSYGS
jgi:hypothetical protein